MLKDDIGLLRQHIKEHDEYLTSNHELIDIFEGDLMKYVEGALRSQLSPQSYEQTVGRVAPVNVLKRIVDKLSRIYQQQPIRRVENGSDSDAELLAWYEDCFKANATMNLSNEFFNMSKSSLVEPYVHNGKPRLRVVPNDRFLMWSNDAIDPTNPTHVIICSGVENVQTDEGTRQTKIYRVYTDDEFLMFDEDGKIRMDLMAAMGNEDGVNPYGKIPFVYVNRSKNFLVPKLDTDMKALSILLPVILSDLAYAIKFQAFSLVYIINGDAENLTQAPNAVWHLESGEEGVAPQVGSIKPEVDIDQVMNFIQSTLSFWLNTRGIRPGSIGTATAANFSSGISKMIDEMDTAEDRMKQVNYYTDAEAELWDLVMKHMHPYWTATGQIDNQAQFNPSAEVAIDFAEQLPAMQRGEIVDDLKSEVDAGFTSTKRAIKKLNPRMTDEEIDALIVEIEDEKTLNMPVNMFEPAEAAEPEEEEE